MTRRSEAEALRQAAEARLKAGLSDLKEPDTDLPRLVHELQVHQIELEMQNQLLRETHVDLETTLARYFELYDFAPVAYFTLDRRGKILQLNHAAELLLGPGQSPFPGQPLRRYVARADLALFATLLADVLRQHQRKSCDITLVKNRPPGGRVYVRLDVADRPEDETFRVAAMDISDRKMAEEALRLSEQKFRSLFAAMTEGIALCELVFDDKGEPIDYLLLDVNPAFEAILNLDRQSMLGRRASEVYGVSPPPDLMKYSEVAMTGRAMSFTTTYESMGKTFAISAFVPAKNQFATVFTDITLHLQHQQQLEYIAHHDPLTELPNRVLLADRLRQAMAQDLRRQQKLAVAYLDLDGFKPINDVYGHDVGDRLLVNLALRMRQALRQGDTLARLGGDEFVAVLSDLADVEACVSMLTRLLDAAAEPVRIGDVSIRVTVSIGVAFYPQQEEVNTDQLLRQADQAMYQAKLAGRNRYHLFDPEQDQTVRNRREALE